MERILICFLLFAWSSGIVKNAPLHPNITVFKEIIQDISNFQKCTEAKTVNETLHAPRNVQDKCLLTAFSSFMNLTLSLEPEGNQQECMRHFLFRIRNVQRIMPHSIRDPKCSACMTYKDQPLGTFLINFKSLLQRMFKKYSSIGQMHMIC